MTFTRFGIPALVALSAFLSAPAPVAGQHASHGNSSGSALVETVRNATAPFGDARNVPPGYGAVLGCDGQ